MKDCSVCRNNISDATGGALNCAREEAGLSCAYVHVAPTIAEVYPMPQMDANVEA